MSSQTQSQIKHLESGLKIISKTGNFIIGEKTLLRAIKNKKIKTVLLAKNIPDSSFTKITDMCSKKSIPVMKSTRNNRELGMICNRPYLVSVLAIIDFGAFSLIKSV